MDILAQEEFLALVDLTEGGVREFMLPTWWLDVKVCAVDADWSGLKFLRRRARQERREA